MNRESAQRSFGLFILVWCAVAEFSLAAVPTTGQSTPPVAESKPVANASASATAGNPLHPQTQPSKTVCR